MHQKSDIKKWLKENGKDCKWLAEQCGVSIGRIHISGLLRRASLRQGALRVAPIRRV